MCIVIIQFAILRGIFYRNQNCTFYPISYCKSISLFWIVLSGRNQIFSLIFWLLNQIFILLSRYISAEFSILRCSFFICSLSVFYYNNYEVICEVISWSFCHWAFLQLWIDFFILERFVDILALSVRSIQKSYIFMYYMFCIWCEISLRANPRPLSGKIRIFWTIFRFFKQFLEFNAWYKNDACFHISEFLYFVWESTS